MRHRRDCREPDSQRPGSPGRIEAKAARTHWQLHTSKRERSISALVADVAGAGVEVSGKAGQRVAVKAMRRPQDKRDPESGAGGQRPRESELHPAILPGGRSPRLTAGAALMALPVQAQGASLAGFQRFVQAGVGQISMHANDINYIDMRYTNGFAIGWRSGGQRVAAGAPEDDTLDGSL